MDTLAVVGEVLRQVAVPAAEETKFQINLFWVIVAAANFVVFFLIVQRIAFGGLVKTLNDRRTRIEQGLQDAEQARRDRESAEQERQAALQEARREANETREQEVAATRDEIARLRDRATSDIEAERQRAVAELRGEVTDLALAAAGRVVGESMTGERQRKLVAEFLSDPAAGGSAG